MTDFSKRIDSLRSRMHRSEAALITSDVNITYFTGFPSSEGALLVTCDGSYFAVDFRYYEAVSEQVKSSKVVLHRGVMKAVGEILQRHNVSSVYLEESTTVGSLAFYKKALPHIEFDTSSFLSDSIKQLRIIKDEDEKEELRTAQKISEKSYLELLNRVKEGVSERELAVELEYLMKKNGAQKTAFDLITIGGENTSKPHGVPGEYRLRKGDFVTFDIGAVYCGYHSDMTRTVALGYADDEMQKIYYTVLKAQLTTLEMIKEGVSAFDADAAARDVIDSAGYKDFFGHAVGHGVGLEIHEFPVLSPNSKEILKSGMIVTVEPGVYLPKKFGVRIEDTVCITKTGCENLVCVGKDLIIV